MSLHTEKCGKKYKGTVRKNSEECSSPKLCGKVPVHSESFMLHSVP